MVTLFVLMLILHWFYDFVAQTHEQAINKNHSWSALLGHTITYSVGISICFGFYLIVTHTSTVFVDILRMFCKFFVITFVAHTATDYITSRESKKFFDKKDYHNGFVVVGFDQILHYLQLFFTYKWLIE